MPTTLTDVGVYNQALDFVNERPLTTPDDDNAYARFLTRHYANTRDAELRKNNWNFAITYHELAQDGTDPAFRFNYRYPLPAGWLRLLPPTLDGKRGAAAIPHEVVGAYVYTDIVTTFKVRCVSRVTDPALWDPLFADALVARLGMKLSLKFTAKGSYYDRAANAYNAAIADAVQADALEGTADPVEASAVITARYRNS